MKIILSGGSGQVGTIVARDEISGPVILAALAPRSKPRYGSLRVDIAAYGQAKECEIGPKRGSVGEVKNAGAAA